MPFGWSTLPAGGGWDVVNSGLSTRVRMQGGAYHEAPPQPVFM